MEKICEEEPVRIENKESGTIKIIYNNEYLTKEIMPIFYQRCIKVHNFTFVDLFLCTKTQKLIVVKEYNLVDTENEDGDEDPDGYYREKVIKNIKFEFKLESSLDPTKVLQSYSLVEQRPIDGKFGIFKVYQEFCEIGDVLAWRRKKIKISKNNINQVLQFAKELVDLIYWFHRQGYIHRDLKLDNVIISKTSDGKLKLKLFDFENSMPNCHEHIKEEIEKKYPAWFLGSLYYRPPDLKEYYSFEWDVFSLGLSLYTLFEALHPLNLPKKHTPEDIIKSQERVMKGDLKLVKCRVDKEDESLNRMLDGWQDFMNECLLPDDKRTKSIDLTKRMQEFGCLSPNSQN